jgi:hypothetical protein
MSWLKQTKTLRLVNQAWRIINAESILKPRLFRMDDDVLLHLQTNEGTFFIKNPLGMLLDKEEIEIETTKFKPEYPTIVTGKKSKIRICPSRTPLRPRSFLGLITGAFFSLDMIPVILLLGKKYTVSGRVIQHKELNLRPAQHNPIQAVNPLNHFTLALKVGLSRIIRQLPDVDEEIGRASRKYSYSLHKFLIEADSGGYLAVDYAGDLIELIQKNEHVKVEGHDISNASKYKNVIVAKNIYKTGRVTRCITSKIPLFLQNKQFKPIEEIEGKVVNVNIQQVNDQNYKRWLKKRDYLIKRLIILNFFSNNGLIDFRVPQFRITLRDIQGGERIVIFRPMWLIGRKATFLLADQKIYRGLKNDILALMLICKGDELRIHAANMNGICVAKIIHNKSVNAFNVGIVDPNPTELPQIALGQEKSFVGRICEKQEVMMEFDLSLFSAKAVSDLAFLKQILIKLEVQNSSRKILLSVPKWRVEFNEIIAESLNTTGFRIFLNQLSNRIGRSIPMSDITVTTSNELRLKAVREIFDNKHKYISTPLELSLNDRICATGYFDRNGIFIPHTITRV